MANAYLDKVFLDQLNKRFTVKAADPTDVHRPAPRNLQRIFCRIEARQVGQDWCVLYDNRVFQLLKREQRLALAKRTVNVHEQLDGQIAICYQGRQLAWRERHRTTGVLQAGKIFAAAAGPLSPQRPPPPPFIRR